MPIEHARNAWGPASLSCPSAWCPNNEKTYDSNEEPNILGSLDLRATQVAQATTFFQHALLPHPMWLGSLPVCLAEHHHGKVRRLRLVLATITHLTKAEITSLVEGPYLPGGTVLHDLVYGSQLMLRSSQSGWSSRMGSSQEVGDFSTTALVQGNDAAWEAPYAINQHQAYVCSAVRRIVPLKHCTGCTSVTRGECSQSLMPLNLTLSFHRNQTF